MFPLRDENPVVRPPVVTVAIIVLNTLAWILLQGWGHETFMLRSLCNYGLIPAELLGKLPPGSVVPLGPQCRLRARVIPPGTPRCHPCSCTAAGFT
ncbi:MAG: hypothetical protein U5P41_02365 [Gammaproteobacteria bacterium]|nr:hypothetical protein [Gammaproteobacteria bacterium]